MEVKVGSQNDYGQGHFLTTLVFSPNMFLGRTENLICHLYKVQGEQVGIGQSEYGDKI